jgi:hypothetical protein
MRVEDFGEISVLILKAPRPKVWLPGKKIIFDRFLLSISIENITITK